MMRHNAVANVAFIALAKQHEKNVWTFNNDKLEMIEKNK